MTKVLITGITGMVGSHMADYLLDKADIVGLKRWRSPMDNIAHLNGKITLHDGDLKDFPSIVDLLKSAKPEIIYHFAAQSYVPVSFNMPVETLLDNVLGTLNLLRAVKILEIEPIIVVASSSEVYGQVTNDDIPITENCPLRPQSEYAVSKVAEDMYAYQYFCSYGMKIIRVRMFTHTGPRRGEVFHESSFAKQIALIEKGKQEAVVKVGNLDSVRTYLDVRDAVKAYWLVKDCPAGEVYNIGGDVVKRIDEVLGFFVSNTTHRGTREIVRIEQDPARMRLSDVTNQIMSYEKFNKATVWRPEISFETTMMDLLNYWRERV